MQNIIEQFLTNSSARDEVSLRVKAMSESAMDPWSD